MEVQPDDNQNTNELVDQTEMNQWEQKHRRGKIFGGLLIVTIGALFLAREMGVLIPHWLFSWKILLIAIGFYIGDKHSFRNVGWLVPVIIGSVFLMQDIYPELSLTKYIWPFAIIAFGLMVIFKPRKHLKAHHWNRYSRAKHCKETYAGETIHKTASGYMEVNAVFGGVKRNSISKEFSGGEINVVFGSAEINLSQADIVGLVVIEINNVFGGTRLIIPSHWELRSELNAVMGGVEDKRLLIKDVVTDSNKILVLKGDVVFGGVEIQSY